MQDPALKAGSLDASLLARKGTARPSAVSRPTRTAPPPAPKHGRPESKQRHRVRVSLRLDETRHHRLRLAAAHQNCSFQALLVAALDEHLAALDVACPCLRRHRAADDADPEEAAS